MSNKGKAIAYNAASQGLVSKVREVVKDHKRSHYSASKTYAAHNEVFNLNETAETCASCLQKRGNALEAWLAKYDAAKSGEETSNVDAGNVVQAGEKMTPEQIAVLKAFLGVSDEDTPEYFAERLGAFLGDPAKFDGVTQAEDIHIDVDVLKALLNELEAFILSGGADKDEPQYVESSAPGFVAPKTGVTRVPLKADEAGNVDVLDFVPSGDNPLKGMVKNANGSGVKPGKYVTGDGRELSVQPGGKATFKEEDLA